MFFLQSQIDKKPLGVFLDPSAVLMNLPNNNVTEVINFLNFLLIFLKRRSKSRYNINNMFYLLFSINFSADCLLKIWKIL